MKPLIPLKSSPLKTVALIFTLALPLTFNGIATPHTPQPGTEERRAICDGVREYVVQHIAVRRLPQPIVFKIDSLRVDEGFAWFEATPRFKDGSYVSTEFLPDMGYIMVLQKAGSKWNVKADLSRSDVRKRHAECL